MPTAIFEFRKANEMPAYTPINCTSPVAARLWLCTLACIFFLMAASAFPAHAQSSEISGNDACLNEAQRAELRSRMLDVMRAGTTPNMREYADNTRSANYARQQHEAAIQELRSCETKNEDKDRATYGDVCKTQRDAAAEQARKVATAQGNQRANVLLPAIENMKRALAIRNEYPKCP